MLRIIHYALRTFFLYKNHPGPRTQKGLLISQLSVFFIISQLQSSWNYTWWQTISHSSQQTCGMNATSCCRYLKKKVWCAVPLVSSFTSDSHWMYFSCGAGLLQKVTPTEICDRPSFHTAAPASEMVLRRKKVHVGSRSSGVIGKSLLLVLMYPF